MKYIFIDNPIAGNKDNHILFEQVKSAFRMSSDEMILEETKGPKHAMEIAANYADKYGKDAVIVSCGGDGTVHEISNGLCGKETPLMILPLGTGNDFAKKIYGTKKINAQNVIKSFGLHTGNIRYKIKPIDLIDYNGEVCNNVMSYGLDTKVETIGRKIAAKIPKLEATAYNIAIIPCVLQSMKYHINIELNCIDSAGRPFVMKKTPMEYTLMAICNASYYGGGFCPAPNSVLDDGLLDLCYVDSVNLIQALPLIPKYSAGTAAETKPKIVHSCFVTSGRIWSTDGKPLLGNCDGENFDYTEVNFKVLPKALNLCMIDK